MAPLIVCMDSFSKPRFGQARLQSPGYSHQPKNSGSGRGTDAARAPCGLPAKALAAGYPPRVGWLESHRLLLGRVHIPLQPTTLGLTRQIVLPPPAASGPSWASNLRQNRWKPGGGVTTSNSGVVAK